MEQQSVNTSFLLRQKLSNADFNRLSGLITKEVGIKMPEIKKIMLQGRLAKRMQALNFTSYKEYTDYVFSREGKLKEIDNMIDVVCTNKTDFFREKNHFEYLYHTLLPAYFENRKNTKLQVWSAGCSTGEEPYTLAMVFHAYFQQNKGGDFQVFASDVSNTVLEQAKAGIYTADRIQGIPVEWQRRYLLRGNRHQNIYKVSEEIQNKVNFFRINLMDAYYQVKVKFDIIFCRNVLIYFDKTTQEDVLNKLLLHLKTGGYLFLGHSESIFNMNLPLVQLKPTIFQKV